VLDFSAKGFYIRAELLLLRTLLLINALCLACDLDYLLAIGLRLLFETKVRLFRASGTWVRAEMETQVVDEESFNGAVYLLVVLELAHFLALLGIRLYQFLF